MEYDVKVGGAKGKNTKAAGVQKFGETYCTL